MAVDLVLGMAEPSEFFDAIHSSVNSRYGFQELEFAFVRDDDQDVIRSNHESPIDQEVDFNFGLKLVRTSVHSFQLPPKPQIFYLHGVLCGVHL